MPLSLVPGEWSARTYRRTKRLAPDKFYKGRSQEKTVLRWLEPNTPRSSHAYPDLDSRNRADAPVATNLIPLKAGEYFAALPVWGAVHGRNAARSSSRLTQPRTAV